MAQRTTDKQLDYQVECLNRELGLPLTPWSMDAAGHNVSNVGNIHIDSAYGGYRLEQMVKGGGTRVVGDAQRMNKGQLWSAVRMMIDAVQQAKKGSYIDSFGRKVENAYVPGSENDGR